MKSSNNISPRTSALIVGFALLLMAVVAGLTYGYLHGNLMVAEDADASLKNLQSSPGLFKAELFGWVVIFLLDGLVAWALFHFFKPMNNRISFLSSMLRVVYTVVLGIAIFNLSKILQVINNPADHSGSGHVMNYLQSFEDLWSKGLIIFGLHLLALGYLAYRAGFVPKFWGILLIIAGLSYSFLHTAYALEPDLMDSWKTLEMILVLPMTLGEVGFAVWLVVRGGKAIKGQSFTNP